MINRTTISVGGKDYPCRLTMGAMLLFKRNTGQDVSQMQEADLEQMLMLMWCCVVSACRAEGVEFDVDFERFCDMVTPQDLNRWNEALSRENEKKSEG